MVFAKTSAKCGDDKLTVATGNSAGKCTHVEGADGKVQSVSCDDGQGNSGSLTCKNGVAFCSASGAGECVFAPDK